MIMVKVLKNTIYLISVIFIIWFMLSWFDVIADNCFPNPVHHPWNFFRVITGGFR